MISAVGHAMSIIEVLADEPQGATLMQLVRRVGIEKSVASRIMATLEADGYVLRQPGTALFSLSMRFTATALRQIERTGLIDLCQPILRSAAERTGELIQLAVVTGAGLTYIAKAQGAHRIQAMPLIGTRAVLHASAAGKLWLAAQDDRSGLKAALQSGLKRFTQHTIVTSEALSAEIRQVRAQGYAILVQELSDDMNAVGVPIRRPRDGNLIGAFLISAPAYRMQRKRMIGLVPELKIWAEQIAGIVAASENPTIAIAM